MGQNVLGRCRMMTDGSKIMILITKDWESLSHRVLQSVVYHELLHSMHPGEHHGGGWAKDARTVSNLTGLTISAKVILDDSFGLSSIVASFPEDAADDVDMGWNGAVDPDLPINMEEIPDPDAREEELREMDRDGLLDDPDDRSELQQEFDSVGLGDLADYLV